MGCFLSTDTAFLTDPIVRRTVLEMRSARTPAQLYNALHRGGLPHACHLIVAVDYTASNEWSGQGHYGNMHLHHIQKYDRMYTRHQNWQNPYISSLQAVGQALFGLDTTEESVELVGFGDVFSNDSPSQLSHIGAPTGGSLELAMREYDVYTGRLLQLHRQGLPAFSGPTNFAPAIRYATAVAQQRPGTFVVLVILTDGTVNGNVKRPGQLPILCEVDTMASICEAGAANTALSIIAVGVGDGNAPSTDPRFQHHEHWGFLHEFEDLARQQRFDDFHFVKHRAFYAHHEEMRSDRHFRTMDFAHDALRRIPYQLYDMRTRRKMVLGGGGGDGGGGGSGIVPASAGGGSAANPLCIFIPPGSPAAGSSFATASASGRLTPTAPPPAIGFPVPIASKS